MSAINGDKSKFHRERKDKIARRARNRKLFKSPQSKAAVSEPRSASKAVSA